MAPYIFSFHIQRIRLWHSYIASAQPLAAWCAPFSRAKCRGYLLLFAEEIFEHAGLQHIFAAAFISARQRELQALRYHIILKARLSGWHYAMDTAKRAGATRRKHAPYYYARLLVNKGMDAFGWWPSAAGLLYIACFIGVIGVFRRDCLFL